MRGCGAGVLGVVLAACGPTTARVGTPARAALSAGVYACRIEDGGYDYPPMRCIVQPDRDRTVLEKVEGTVRFRGLIVGTPSGFRFDGEVYCPWGDCVAPVHAEFRAAGGGSYVATFDGNRGSAMTVTLAPAMHGGDGYGTYGYGGSGYGGDSDGGYDH